MNKKGVAMSEHMCILGAGAWGTAVATLLANNGHTVTLWCYEQDVAQALNETHCNQKYLPDIQLSTHIHATSNLGEAFAGATYIFEATPVQFLRPVLESCQSLFTPEQVWVSLSKGIEQHTLMFPSAMMRDVFGNRLRVAVVGGPGFAKNLAHGELTAVMVAAQEESLVGAVAHLLACDYFKPICSVDTVGVELCGAIKNVLSLGMGMLEGAGYGDNARALFLTAGFQDMLVCGFGLGAKIDTLHGLAGFGDLILSSMGELGRNLALGKRLGSGSTIDSSVLSSGLMPEGMNSCRAMEALANKIRLNLPVLCGIQAVVEGRKTIQDVMKELAVPF
jgi:glycerol-3-phosphate dehydrogenase (NAD(P)+)